MLLGVQAMHGTIAVPHIRQAWADLREVCLVVADGKTARARSDTVLG
jgi:hypothetical protein